MSTAFAERSPADPLAGRRHVVTVDDYYRMAEVGLLGPEDRVELIEGEIIDMTPIGSAHAGCVDRLNNVLSPSLHGRAIVRVQGPVRLGRRSEPQPDLAVLCYRDDFYATAHPGPADVLLIIEVADTTARYDRDVKVPLYARQGIGEVWLVDLEAGRVEVYREPEQGAYRRVERLREGMLAPAAYPDVQVDIGALLA